MDQVEALAGQQAVPPASNNAAKGRSTKGRKGEKNKCLKNTMSIFHERRIVGAHLLHV